MVHGRIIAEYQGPEMGGLADALVRISGARALLARSDGTTPAKLWRRESGWIADGLLEEGTRATSAPCKRIGNRDLHDVIMQPTWVDLETMRRGPTTIGSDRGEGDE